MASAAEQLAANLSWENFGRAKDLQRRIFYTLFLLVIFRVGTFVPIPGIDGEALNQFFENYGAGFGDMINMFTGGALQQAAIFSLGIMPYISASIIMQLLAATLPSLEALKKEGEPGRRKINQYTRYLTLAICLVQGYFMVTMMESNGLAHEPGWFFRITALATLVGGSMFLLWLGEQITARGIGNGVSLIIFVGIIANLPVGIAQFFTSSEQQGRGFLPMIFLILLVLGLLVFVVFVERAMRKVTIQYQRRQVGNKMYGGDTSHLPIKLNPSGVIPAIFATSVLVMPMTFASSRLQGTSDTGFMGRVMALIGAGQPLYYLLFAFLIVFFAYFYTLNVAFKTDDAADNLKKHGGFIPGIRPGARTAEYLEYVVNRILVAGSIYLVIVCVAPDFVRTAYSLPFVLSGTSILIVVSVTMDTVSQIQSHLLAYQYEGLLNQQGMRGKNRAKARRRNTKPRQKVKRRRN